MTTVAVTVDAESCGGGAGRTMEGITRLPPTGTGGAACGWGFSKTTCGGGGAGWDGGTATRGAGGSGVDDGGGGMDAGGGGAWAAAASGATDNGAGCVNVSVGTIGVAGTVAWVVTPVCADDGIAGGSETVFAIGAPATGTGAGTVLAEAVDSAADTCGPGNGDAAAASMVPPGSASTIGAVACVRVGSDVTVTGAAGTAVISAGAG